MSQCGRNPCEIGVSVQATLPNVRGPLRALCCWCPSRLRRGLSFAFSSPLKTCHSPTSSFSHPRLHGAAYIACYSMEISRDDSIALEPSPSTSMDFGPPQQLDPSSIDMTTTYSMLVDDHCHSIEDPHAHSTAAFGPLSIPIFTTPFTSSGLVPDMPPSISTTQDEAHFDYDEQVPEELEDSDDDSSAAFHSNGIGSTSSTGYSSDFSDLSFVYDGLLMPRRSNRERRLPTPFEIALPKETRMFDLFHSCR